MPGDPPGWTVPPVLLRVPTISVPVPFRVPPLIPMLVPFVVIYLIAIAAPNGIAPFIYFQF